MLGIGIGDAREGQRDDGVAVLSVSPGGPAANAGIKAGDVLVELNGKSLKRDKDDSRTKLLNEMGKLSPGDEVSLRYLRDGKNAVVKFKVDRLPREELRSFRFRLPRDERFDTDDWDDWREFAGMRGPLGDMELVALTPKLGQYFGADKGLLIVRAPHGAPDGTNGKLEDGDVLVDIDGRAPSDPSHAFRILRSYQPGEKVTLNVLRQRKKTPVTITMPEREGRGPRPSPRPPMPPRPPTPPAAPAPTGA